MKNLPMPSRDGVQEHLERTIREYQYGGETKGYAPSAAEIQAVIALYDLYDQQSAAPDDLLKGETLEARFREELHDNYDRTQLGGMLSGIRETLFSGVGLCPVCGIDPVVQLDHHLPRSAFKPLSVYPRNLVPLCYLCNWRKNAGFGDQNEEEKRFIHAYFDLLPDVTFLTADVTLRNDGLIVEFRIDPLAALPGRYIERLSHQLTTLKLNDRYTAEVNNHISSLAVALYTIYDAGGNPATVRYLRSQALYEERAFYRNHWRPTLLRALAAHDAFVDGGFKEVFPMPPDLVVDMANLQA